MQYLDNIELLSQNNSTAENKFPLCGSGLFCSNVTDVQTEGREFWENFFFKENFTIAVDPKTTTTKKFAQGFYFRVFKLSVRSSLWRGLPDFCKTPQCGVCRVLWIWRLRFIQWISRLWCGAEVKLRQLNQHHTQSALFLSCL